MLAAIPGVFWLACSVAWPAVAWGQNAWQFPDPHFGTLSAGSDTGPKTEWDYRRGITPSQAWGDGRTVIQRGYVVRKGTPSGTRYKTWSHRLRRR
jgi:hypothetical protein